MILTKTRLFVIVVVLISLAVPGCANVISPQPTKKIDVPIDDVRNQKIINRDITLAVGDTLRLTLGSNETTPYRWTANTKIGDPAIVQQTSHEYVKPNSQGSGAPGTEVWTFKALKAGTTTIAAEYTYIGGVGTVPPVSCTFTANVTVQ